MNPIEHSNVGEEYHVRQQTLSTLREQGFTYPNHFRPEDTAQALLSAHTDTSKADLEANPVSARIAGRIVLQRVMGKVSFFHLQDHTGRIQVYLKENDHPEAYALFAHCNLGDIIGVEGTLFQTNTGELTLRTQHLEIISKALRPLPDKFHGLSDQEICYRKRYVDLMVNEDTRKTFIVRSQLIQQIRRFMDAEAFLEVETPMMHPIPGGAVAKPFVTHHNSLDKTMYLRVAPELYLKRLMVGGFPKVYEINRNFRNEGLSPRHNPEFTMMEFYQAYADYTMLMDFTERLLASLANTIIGHTEIPYQDHVISFKAPFARFSVSDAIRHYLPEVPEACFNDKNACQQVLSRMDIPFTTQQGLGSLLMLLFEEKVEHLLIQPTFITEYPTEISPLARRNDQNPDITDRFEFFIAGREIANGFSELNDPEDQAQRFKEQVAQKDAGDQEAMHFDSDYIEALEYGMPPTAGEGIGIDRLVMLFTNSASIRDVILFPSLR
ncbi:MAG: lysine--tRNA ligase [Legionellaceae bacterium]|nr:lysine--tRNA ligase [Legionellaceae bacterium]